MQHNRDGLKVECAGIFYEILYWIRIGSAVSSSYREIIDMDVK